MSTYLKVIQKNPFPEAQGDQKQDQWHEKVLVVILIILQNPKIGTY